MTRGAPFQPGHRALSKTSTPLQGTGVHPRPPTPAPRRGRQPPRRRHAAIGSGARRGRAGHGARAGRPWRRLVGSVGRHLPARPPVLGRGGRLLQALGGAETGGTGPRGVGRRRRWAGRTRTRVRRGQEPGAPGGGAAHFKPHRQRRASRAKGTGRCGRRPPKVANGKRRRSGHRVLPSAASASSRCTGRGAGNASTTASRDRGTTAPQDRTTAAQQPHSTLHHRDGGENTQEPRAAQTPPSSRQWTYGVTYWRRDKVSSTQDLFSLKLN